MTKDGPIYNKFDVRRCDGSDEEGGKHDGCNYFVLDLNHDPHAREAVKAYAASCQETHPMLARSIYETLHTVRPVGEKFERGYLAVGSRPETI